MSRGRAILVIDDEAVVRASCERILGEEGYRVRCAERGEEGLALLREGGFDAVLLDLKMPGRSGMEVLERIRGTAPEVPVVVITGYATGETRDECLAAGAAAWLAKPFGPDELLAAVGAVLGG